MSRTHNRYQHKKIAKAAQDLLFFFCEALYSSSPRLRRAMALEELEQEVQATGEYFSSWLEQRDRRAALRGGEPLKPDGKDEGRSGDSLPFVNATESGYFWDQMRMSADISTGLWRLRREWENPSSHQTEESFRRPFNALMSVWDQLAAAGFSILDYTGRAEEANRTFFLIPQEKNLANPDAAGFETIKPAIFCRYRQHSWQIQVGHAIDLR